ncbi:hypothetical protein [Streptomyces sp. ISL-11]|uniref:hypothetical protein n=1 Tax=Streptomyces sp. ISL-11 TaxID=2819174 RepID=UPI001BE80BB0|nr:hypothetical protein [Streptomyces sp. ISL-11]MBT2384412.1 hypothetical protein [Streptomyces sp. ISL-11]
MHRTAPRLARILACAAVPVMLVATGCSDDDGGGAKKASATPSKAAPSASATTKAATFAKLPDVCRTVSEKTVDKLVPKAKKKEGEALPATDANDSASCFWNGLNDEDAKDLQFRTLTISLKRFTADPTLGSGEKRAEAFVGQRTTKAATEDGAKEAKTEKVSGIGDEANSVASDYRKDDDDYRNAIVVTRNANVVITVKYSGAGYQGAKNPDAGDLMKDAQSAAKEAVTSVADANKK